MAGTVLVRGGALECAVILVECGRGGWRGGDGDTPAPKNLTGGGQGVGCPNRPQGQDGSHWEARGGALLLRLPVGSRRVHKDEDEETGWNPQTSALEGPCPWLLRQQEDSAFLERQCNGYLAVGPSRFRRRACGWLGQFLCGEGH
jgi:hypothetical protein